MKRATKTIRKRKANQKMERLFRKVVWLFTANVFAVFVLVFLITLNTIKTAELSHIQKQNKDLASEIASLESTYLKLTESNLIEEFASKNNMTLAEKSYLSVTSALTQR